MIGEAKHISLRIARWSVVGIGVSMPISTAMDNVLMLVLLLAVVLGGHLKEVARIAWQVPVARAAMFLFLALICGNFYGEGRESLKYLGKYIDIAFVPIFIWALSDPVWKRHAAHGFLLAMGLVLALSVGLFAGVVPGAWFPSATAAYPVVFKLSITHNYFMAILVLFAVVYARQGERPVHASLWLGLALLGASNVMFMVPGRTGQIILVLILTYLAASQMKWRYMISIAALIGIGVALLYYLDQFSSHWEMAFDEIRAWQSGVRGDNDSSVGTRLDYYFNTLDIIAEHPWLGVGTEGFPAAYDAIVAGAGMPGSKNPHSQYLLFTAQLGVGGLILFVGLLAVMAKQIISVADLPSRQLAWGIWIALVVGNLANSFFLDHAEGLFAAWAIGWATFVKNEGSTKTS